MRNLVAALVFVIAAAAFAVARTPADEDAHRTDAVAEPVVESTCERYGQAAENGETTQERARPAWLTDYSLHMNLIGVLGSPSGSPPGEDPKPVEVFESGALMDSLSPGVRASYEGWLLARAHARRSKRLQEEAEYAAEHLREEAEYAAFIEERMRRLNERNEEAHD